MSASSEQRDFNRLSMYLEIEVICKGVERDDYKEKTMLQNISGGGAAFTTRQPEKFFAGQELEIVDWKTYYKGLSKAQAAKELQLRWYLLTAIKVWPGFPSYRFTFDFVRLGYQVSAGGKTGRYREPNGP